MVISLKLFNKTKTLKNYVDKKKLKNNLLFHKIVTQNYCIYLKKNLK